MTNSIALLIVLDSLDEGNGAVLLANTHIWWNTKSADVQLAQTECVLKAIADIQATEGTLPAILCGMRNGTPHAYVTNLGDFNSIPSTPPIMAALNWVTKPLCLMDS